MFTMTSSARSLQRFERVTDDNNAHLAPKLAAPSCLQLPGDACSKRSSITRSALGGMGRLRLSRSGCSLEAAGSENVAPEKRQQPPASGGSVLGDVTNVFTAGGVEIQPKLSCGEAPVHEQGPAPLASMGVAVASTSTDQLELDVRHADDPQYVQEYMKDIFDMLQRVEGHHEASSDYMERQAHVNIKMRGILVDWLVSVQQKYKLKAETLFLAISLLDRYLEKKATARRHLQLVGVTVLLIAAKFEEMHPPEIGVLVYVTDKAYTREDIIKMEVSILTTLDFRICSPTPMQFLERYQSVNGCDEAHRSLTQYLVELTLVDYNMLKYRASIRAASAVFLSNKLLRHQPAWKAALVKHSGFTEAMLKDCAKEMCALLEKAESNSLQAVRKKFSQSKYQSVAKLNFTSVSPPGQTSEEPRNNIPRRSFAGERRRSVTGNEPSLGSRLPLSSQGVPPRFLEQGGSSTYI